jgi:hypothetical protein
MRKRTAINPDKITEYNVPKERLESQIVFWIAVAGKTYPGAELHF